MHSGLPERVRYPGERKKIHTVKAGENMSCWRQTTVLRIPAICLGFETWGEWHDFLGQHRKEFHWDPGYFASALCDSYIREDYDKWLPHEGRGYEDWDRLDMDLYPDTVKSVPGPFLDYFLEDIAPVPSEKRTYNQDSCARPLEPDEKEKYLPLYQQLVPAFTLENMNDVHYCRYEWYDGCDAGYYY